MVEAHIYILIYLNGIYSVVSWEFMFIDVGCTFLGHYILFVDISLGTIAIGQY